MRIARRKVLTGFAAFGALAGGIGAYGLWSGGIRNHTLDVIGRVFGADIAGHPAAVEFAQAYEEFVRAKGPSGLAANAILRLGLGGLPKVRDRTRLLESSIVSKFVTSTNVVLASERGTDLEFIALFTPRETPCLNQLSAQVLT